MRSTLNDVRIAVISDVHGNLPALKTVLTSISAHEPDLVVNLGDVASAPLWPSECVQLLNTIDVVTIRGNHDRWLTDPSAPDTATVKFTRDVLSAAEIQQLSTLPATMTIDGGILAVHGRPDTDMEYLLEDLIDGRVVPSRNDDIRGRLAGASPSLVLCGHSHTQRWAHVDATTIVNPGSVGSPRYAENTDLSKAECGSPHARYAIVTRRDDKWEVEMLALAYDFDAVVARARSFGRDDWARGFMAGYAGSA